MLVGYLRLRLRDLENLKHPRYCKKKSFEILFWQNITYKKIILINNKKP